MRYFFFILISCFALGLPAQPVSDESSKERMIQFIKKKAANRKCNLNDSTAEKLYYFFMELRTAPIACRKDSTCNKSDCLLLIAEMKISLRKKYGEDVYKIYEKISYSPPTFPKLPGERTDSTDRRKRSTYQRQF